MNICNGAANLLLRAARKSEPGVSIRGIVSESLENITSKVTEMDLIIAPITSGSNEQDRGISQITEAVKQMSRVTQRNAANADQTAEASEKLTAQAAELQSIVEELVKFVGQKDSYN